MGTSLVEARDSYSGPQMGVGVSIARGGSEISPNSLGQQPHVGASSGRGATQPSWAGVEGGSWAS